MDESQLGSAAPPPRRPLMAVAFAGIALLILLGGSVLILIASTQSGGAEELGLAFYSGWPVFMFMVWLLGNAVFFATRTTRSSGLSMALLAWLGVCVLALPTLPLVFLAIGSVGVAWPLAVGAALILVDAGVVYAGWHLIRARWRLT